MPHNLRLLFSLTKMGIWKQNAEKPLSFLVPSPLELSKQDDDRLQRARDSAQEGLIAGLRSAAVAGVATALPVLLAGQKIAWIKRNVNYTAQALIICSASMAAYYIVSDHTIMERARSGSYNAIRAQQEA